MFQVRHKESDKVDPWTSIAKCKWQVEQHLHTIPGLNFTIVRPAIVYGIGDRNGIGNLFAYYYFFKFCYSN